MHSKPASPSIAQSILGGLVLAGTLGAVVLIVGLVSKPSVRDPQPRAPQRASQPTRTAAPTTPVPRVSTIVSTIQEFQMGIPLLEQTGLSRQQDPGGIEYRWASGGSWIKFYDLGADGKLDRISAVLATPQDNPDVAILSAGLTFRIVQLASGKDITVEELNAWVSSAAQGDVLEGEARIFNQTPMRLQGTFTADGKTGIRLTVGECD